jgi:hypothetical protein
MAIFSSKILYRELRQAMRKLQKRLSFPAPYIMKGAKGPRGARAFMAKWFDTRGQGTWAPLSRATLKKRRESRKPPKRGKKTLGYYRRYGGGGSRPLMWAKGLKRSWSVKSAPGHIERITGKGTFIFGSDYTVSDDNGKRIQVVRIHNLGRGRSPKRSMLPARKLRKFFIEAANAMVQVQKGFVKVK